LGEEKFLINNGKLLTMVKNMMEPVVQFPAKVLQPLKDYLIREQKRLLDRKKRLEKEDPFSDPERTNDNAAIDTDVAEQVGHERVSTIKEEVDKALINVRKTLTKIKLGRYGICSNCGKMINTDRLAINPTADLCIKCETALEKKKK